MKRNKEFFNGKTWADIFLELNFEKHLLKLQKKFKDKKIILYGAGIMMDYIVKNYDLRGFNIVAVSDKKFKLKEESVYFGYKAIPPELLPDMQADIILITTQYPYSMLRYLQKEIFVRAKMPKVYFLLNKPFLLYAEEIFSN